MDNPIKYTKKKKRLCPKEYIKNNILFIGEVLYLMLQNIKNNLISTHYLCKKKKKILN